MRIGIEIETHVSPDVEIGSYRSGVNAEGMRGWVACSDSSIHPPVGRRGCEFKTSAPLELTADNLLHISNVIHHIKNNLGAKVNSSCGLHIHIEWDSNDLKKLRRLVHTVAHYEEAFYGVTGTLTRKNGQWCRSIKTSHRAISYRRTRNARTNSQNFEGVRRSSNFGRYHVLNLVPLINGYRNAVEFRVFAGTLNVTKILGAICLCAGVVESCLGRTSTPAWDAPTGDRESYRTDGTSELTLTRLFYRLGWWPKKSRKGVDELIKANEAGLNVPSLRTIKKMMVKMCKKYDVAARRRDARHLQFLNQTA